MKRRVFKVMVGVSVVLFAMWVGSYRISCENERTHRLHSATRFECEADRIRINEGTVFLDRFSTYANVDIPDDENDLPRDGYCYSLVRASPQDLFNLEDCFFGDRNSHSFGWERQRLPYPNGWQVDQSLFLPVWFPPVVFTTPIGLAFVVRRRGNHSSVRTNQPRCRVCNYDLRATSDRCPECGTIPTKAAEAQS